MSDNLDADSDLPAYPANGTSCRISRVTSRLVGSCKKSKKNVEGLFHHHYLIITIIIIIIIVIIFVKMDKNLRSL